MDIYNYLKKDHKLVEELMRKIISTISLDKRKDYFDEMKKELLLHAETEHQTFYQALRDNGDDELKEKIKHADKEHSEVEEYLSKITRMSVEGEKWLEQFGELKHAVDHHVEEEEKEIFKMAKEILSDEQAEKLAKEMAELKKDNS